MGDRQERLGRNQETSESIPEKESRPRRFLAGRGQRFTFLNLGAQQHLPGGRRRLALYIVHSRRRLLLWKSRSGEVACFAPCPASC